VRRQWLVIGSIILFPILISLSLSLSHTHTYTVAEVAQQAMSDKEEELKKASHQLESVKKSAASELEEVATKLKQVFFSSLSLFCIGLLSRVQGSFTSLFAYQMVSLNASHEPESVKKSASQFLRTVRQWKLARGV